MSAAMKLIDQTIFLLLFSFYICVNSGKISDLKLCADEDCQATISKAQALANYNPNDPTFLSFKRGSVISVKSKSAGSRPDLWSGEINGVRGYFPYAFVREFDVAHRKLDHIVPTEKHLSPGELALQKSEDAKKQQEVTKEAPSDQEEKNAATQDEVAKRPDTVAAPVKDSQKHDTQANIPPPPFKETGAAQTQDPATTQKQNVAAKEEVAQPATTDHKLKVGEGVIIGNNNQEGVDNMKVAEEEIDDTEVDVEPESQTQTSKDDVKESILPKVDEGKTDDSEIDETELEDYDEDHDDNKDVDETEVPDDDDSWSFANDNKNKNENAADKIDEMFSHLNDISPQNVDKHSAEDLNKYLKNTFSGGSDETELKKEKIENADTPQELEAKRLENMKESIQKELEKDKTSQVKEEKELPKDALPKDTFDVRLDDEEEDATEIMDEEALTDSFVKISGEQTEQDPQNSPEVQKSEEKTPPLANQEPPVVSKAPPVEDKPIVEVLRKEDLDGLDSQKNEQMPAQKPDIPAETVLDATATQETEKPPERLTVPQQTEDSGINATPTQTPPTADKGVPDAAKTSQIVIDGTTIDLNEDYENSLLYTSSQLDIESSTGQLNHVDNLASDQQVHSPAEQIMASADPLHQEDHNGDPIVDILQHKIDSIPAQPDLHLKPESPSAYQSNDYLSRKPLAVNAQSVGQAPVASSQDAPSSGEKAYQTNQQPVYNQDLPKDNAGSLDILDLNPVDNSNQQQNEPHSQVEIENRNPSQSKDWPNGNEQEKETLGDTEVKEEVFAEVTTHPPVVGEPIPPPLEEFTKVPEPVIATEATTKATTQASVTDATTQTQTETTTETDPVTKATTQSTYGSDQLPEDNKQEPVKNQETYDGEPVIPYDEFPTPDNMEDSFSDIPEERIRESKSLDGVPPTDDDPYKTDPVSSRKMTDEHLEDDQFGVPPKRNGLFDRLFSPILSVLPGFLGRILDQEPLGLSPAMTLLMIITTFIILTITTCCSRSSSGGGKKTADALAVVRKLEEKLFIETKEKENLEDALNQAKKEIIDYEKKLTNQQSKSGSHKADLQNLQLHNESLKQQVVSFQTQIKEYNDEVKDIQGASHGKDKKVKDLEKQVNKLEERAKKAEKALDKKCKEIEDNKEEVETKRSQMKSLSDQVQQLEIRKQQLLSEAADWKEKVEDLNERLYQRDEEFKQMQESVTFKDSELEVLKECFLQLKAFEDESEMKEDPSESSIAVQDKLQTMIDVAKVNATLRAVQDEKDTLTNRLEIETEARKEAEDQLDKARLNMESFQADKMKAERQFQESQTKLNVLSNYFKEKEMQLQRELGEQEVLKKQNINKLNSVDEKSKQTEEERAMYKQQVESLKRELEAADRDFRAQIAANEQKAHENWIAARTAERELKESRHQNTTLRQRLTDFTRKPGPEGLIRPLPTRGLPPGMMNGPPMPLPPGMDRPPVERSPSRGSLPPPHPPSGDYYNDRLPPPDRRLPPGGPRLPPPPLDARSPPPFDRRPPPPHLDRRTPPYRPPHPDMMPPYRGPPPPRDGISSPPPLGPPGYDPRLGPRTSSPYTRPPPPGAPPRDMRDKPPPRQQSQV